MDFDDNIKPDNLPGTGKPWEPDYSHTDPDIDMKGLHYHGWILHHDPETLAPYYTPMLRAYLSRNNANYHAKKTGGAQTRQRRPHGDQVRGRQRGLSGMAVSPEDRNGGRGQWIDY